RLQAGEGSEPGADAAHRTGVQPLLRHLAPGAVGGRREAGDRGRKGALMRLGYAPLLACLLLAACSGSKTPTVDPCAQVVCGVCQDCIEGNCVDRPTDGGTGCLSNKDCAFVPDRHVCNLADGSCVGCVGDNDCPGGTCIAHACKDAKCKTNDDCTSSEA